MKKRQQEVKEGVHLATMHSSKGLEYDKVFILDAAEGITPYKKGGTGCRIWRKNGGCFT